MKRTKTSKKPEPKIKAEEGMIDDGTREPIYEIDEANDVSTISAQVIIEKIYKGGEFNYNSYALCQMTANQEVNMSDTVIIISAAILNRIGAPKAAQEVLSDSDEAATYYNTLGLNNKTTLNTFSSLLVILAPELLKACELAILSLMSKTSRKTRVSHTATRMSMALAGATGSGILSEEDAELSAVMANFSSSNSKASLASRLIEGPNSDVVNPEESVSRPNSRPSSSNDMALAMSSGMEISSKNLMRFAKAKASGPVADFNSVFRPATKPVQATAKRNKQGLGYISDDSTDEESNNTKRTNKGKQVVKGSNANLVIRSRKSSLGQKILNTAQEIEVVESSGSLPRVDDAADSDIGSI